MSGFKGLHRDTEYALVHKSVALFGDLSLKARGLYAVLCCWPIGEKVSISAVMRVVPDGREAVTNARRELMDAGLLSQVGSHHALRDTSFGKPARNGRSVTGNTETSEKPARTKPVPAVKPKPAPSTSLPGPARTEPLFPENPKAEEPDTNSIEREFLKEGEGGIERATTMRRSFIGEWDRFKLLKPAREAEALGIDVEHYFNAILEWSNKNNRKLRTAHGWVDTVKGAIRRDREAGKLRMKNNPDKQDDQLHFLNLGRE